MAKNLVWIMGLVFFFLAAYFTLGKQLPDKGPAVKEVSSFDKIKLVYSRQGKKEPALVFIHGGFADRSFWKNQVVHFKNKYLVVAVDLAGHGDSGDNRKEWDLAGFAKDVRAVIENEKINKAVLIGNSLGGPVALQTARLIPDRITAVVGVDTLHFLNRRVPEAVFQARAKALRCNFSATMKQMVGSLFHPNTYPELQAYAEKLMLDNSPEMAASLTESFAGMDLGKLVKGLDIPIRCINGDLYPTQIEKNRQIYPDFDAVILAKTGHYPMLENPQLFNKTLEKILKDLSKK